MANERSSRSSSKSPYPIHYWTLAAGRSTFSSLVKIDILTLFPDICRAPLGESIMKRAQENGIVDLQIHNLRDWTTDKQDRKSTRLNSSHSQISYAVFCLKKKKNLTISSPHTYFSHGDL